MPSLAQIADSSDLLNRYLEKTIIYVEGKEDAAFFTDLVGRDLEDRLEFREPAEGSGFREVKKRVELERPANKKIHGLVDGEAAVAYGHFTTLLASDGLVFQLEEAEYDGLLFLTENELENLLFRHVDVAQFVSRSVTMAQLGSVQKSSVEAAIKLAAKRFYFLALLKFAAVHLHEAGKPCKAVDDRAGQFQTIQGAARVMRDIKPEIVANGVAWEDFSTVLRDLAAKVIAHFETQQLDEGLRHVQRLRLADGKSMLNYVRSRYKGSKQWEGQLAGMLKDTAYPGQLIEVLRDITGFNDN